MAVNSERSMNQDFNEGSIDRTYIQLTPSRACVENPPIERLQWPQYTNCERFSESPFLEAQVRLAGNPREIKTTGDGDNRF